MSPRLLSAAWVGVVLLVVGSVAYVRSLATSQAGDGCAPVADGTAISATQPDATTATTQAGEDESLPRTRIREPRFAYQQKMAPRSTAMIDQSSHAIMRGGYAAHRPGGAFLGNSRI